MVGPTITTSKPDVVIFKPYEVAPVKAGGPQPQFVVPLPRQDSVHATTLEPEEFRPPTYINLKPSREFVLDEFGDPPLLDGTSNPNADLGIDLDSMKEKIKMVATLKKPT